MWAGSVTGTWCYRGLQVCVVCVYVCDVCMCVCVISTGDHRYILLTCTQYNIPLTCRTRFDSKARTIVQALTGGGDISHDNANNNDDDNDTKDDIKDDKKHTNQDHNTYTNDDKDTSDNKNDTYDFAFLHVKAVDDTGHDRAVHLKVRAVCAVLWMSCCVVIGIVLHHPRTTMCLPL